MFPRGKDPGVPLHAKYSLQQTNENIHKDKHMNKDIDKKGVALNPHRAVSSPGLAVFPQL